MQHPSILHREGLLQLADHWLNGLLTNQNGVDTSKIVSFLAPDGMDMLVSAAVYTGIDTADRAYLDIPPSWHSKVVVLTIFHGENVINTMHVEVFFRQSGSPVQDARSWALAESSC